MKDISVLLEENTALSQQIKQLQEKQSDVKDQMNTYFDKQKSSAIVIGSYVAKKQIRKGSVKTKLLQAKYKISDDELDKHYRNKPSEFWIVRESTKE